MTNQEIIDKHGMPGDCSCEKCQSMCKTPCIPTPTDVIKIIEHGDLNIIQKIWPTNWATGLFAGTHDRIIQIMAPELDTKKGHCVFFKNGLCQLHDLGLKPLEGRLASCKATRALEESPLFDIIKTWENDGN